MIQPTLSLPHNLAPSKDKLSCSFCFVFDIDYKIYDQEMFDVINNRGIWFLYRTSTKEVCTRFGIMVPLWLKADCIKTDTIINDEIAHTVKHKPKNWEPHREYSTVDGKRKQRL